METSSLAPASVTRHGRAFVIHDPRLCADITPAHFEAAWWQARGLVTGAASGRGTVTFVRAPQGGDVWALRHYLRGGRAARITRDRYVWTGLKRTRAWREWRLTRDLHARGLPVPAPVAARVQRARFTYTADLITRRIDDTRTLAAVLSEVPLPAAGWRELGVLLRRLQEAGVRHDDLNVSNILVHASGSFHVIDFDKAVIAAPGAWRERNLARFRRSLDKQQRRQPAFAFSAADWDNLRTGYDAPPG